MLFGKNRLDGSAPLLYTGPAFGGCVTVLSRSRVRKRVKSFVPCWNGRVAQLVRAVES